MDRRGPPLPNTRPDSSLLDLEGQARIAGSGGASAPADGDEDGQHNCCGKRQQRRATALWRVAVVLAIHALAQLPDGNDRPRGEHVVCGVAVHQDEIGAQTGGDAPAIAQRERGSWERGGRL